jgi:hypothetical protein
MNELEAMIFWQVNKLKLIYLRWGDKIIVYVELEYKVLWFILKYYYYFCVLVKSIQGRK